MVVSWWIVALCPVYSPDIPVCSADCTLYTPSTGTLAYTVSSPLGEFSICTFCYSYSQSLQCGFFVPLGTHHCWVSRGSMEWKVCLTLLRMTSSGNQTQALLILSPMPYLLSHMLDCLQHKMSCGSNPTQVELGVHSPNVLLGRKKKYKCTGHGWWWWHWIWVCVVSWHLVSVSTFSVMYDHTIFYVSKSPNQTSAHKQNRQSA